MESNHHQYEQLKVIDEEKGIIAPSIYDCFHDKFPEFICQICLAFVIDPISCTGCDALFCKKCIYDYSNYSRTCPNRCEIKLKPVNRILRNMINQVRVNCPFFFKGCTSILNYSNYNKHIIECEYGPYICKRCNMSGIKPNIIAHVKICDDPPKDYPNSKCPSCGIIILNTIALLTHIFLCPEQLMTCHNCERKYSLREMRKHQMDNNCLITQLENKISFLNTKVRFYENQLNSEGNKIDQYPLKENPIKKSMTFSNNNKSNSNSKMNSGSNADANGNSNVKSTSKSKATESKKPKERIKIKKIELTNRSMYAKSSKIKSLLLRSNEEMIFSSEDNTLEIDKVDYSISQTRKIIFNEIKDKKESISKMILFNKRPSESNEEITTEDLFIATTNGFYFIYNINNKDSAVNLVKIGKAVNSSITAIEPLPDGLLALGTLCSNLCIINPYSNKTLDTLNHSRKEILSITYIRECLITSSTKESSFYLWKKKKNSDSDSDNDNEVYELKASIKEHTGWVWVSIEMTLNNNPYLITGSGDKRIIIWKFYPNEETVKNCLCLKGNNDSVTCLRLYHLGKQKILISGSYDGVVKVNSIDYDSEEEGDSGSLSSRCLLSIYCKDDIISSVGLFALSDDDYCLVTTSEGYEGFIANEITCYFI